MAEELLMKFMGGEKIKKLKRFGTLFFWGCFLVLFQNCAGDNLGKLAAGISSSNSASLGSGLAIPVAAPVIQSLTSTSSRVSWALSGGAVTSLKLNNTDVMGVNFLDVAPLVTTTYTLVATNSAGFMSASTTITVASPTPTPTPTPSPSPSPVITIPSITGMSSNPSVITLGTPQTSSVISWTTTGTTPITYKLNGNTVTGNSATVSPTTTTIYTLVATNSAGSDSHSVTITVNPASNSQWVYCSTEYLLCSFTGTHRVLFGVSTTSQNTIITATDGANCDVATFGNDPASGANKFCWYEATAITPTPSPTATPSPTGGGTGAVSVTFSSSTENFINPERGFYNKIYTVYDSGTDTVVGDIDAASIQYRIHEYTSTIGYDTHLLWSNQDWSGFINKPLSNAYLTTLQNQLDAVRSVGAKIIFIAYYNTDNGAEAPISLALQQLQQIKPILTKNADVIAYIEGGLIGEYGEGAGGTPLGTDANRAAIRDAWLQVAPSQFSIQFQPADVQAWNGMARISSHNMCFLANQTDGHQFSGLTDPLRDYIKNINLNVLNNGKYGQPFGTETCSNSAYDGSGPRLACSDVLSEGPAYGVTFMDVQYDKLFINSWASGVCLPQVARNMGYRIQLDSITHNTALSAGSSLNVTLNVRNTGWSRIFSARKFVVTLINQTTKAVVMGSAGNANSLPASAKTSTAIVVNVPNIPAGTYDVYVSMPDIYPTTSSNANYAVRFANGDDTAKGQSWDAKNARFQTGTTVTAQ